MPKQRVLIIAAVLAAVLVSLLVLMRVMVIELDESNNGQKIRVFKGQKVELSLPSNPSTGYSWSYRQQPDGNIIKQTGHQYLPPDSGLIGGGGTEHWTFQAVAPGETGLVLVYSRPWESVQPLKRFMLTFEVLPI
ncbi:MAG: protease inhibitor I42 family protein [Syntrophomonadaceae bacterium]|nr:protease inhibitor I42 family protein [Syntrophomonadaceae bacterium]